jgi:hypothetical protein
MRTRRRFSAEFKAKVALQETVAELNCTRPRLQRGSASLVCLASLLYFFGAVFEAS